MDDTAWRDLFATVPIARLATVSRTGPHVVPIVFALEGDKLFSAVDHKPKKTSRLARLVNIERDPRVAVLADRYDDDWRRLWWVRADGRAAILRSGAAHEHAIELLVDRYPQYGMQRPSGPVIEIDVVRWIGWSATDPQ